MFVYQVFSTWNSGFGQERTKDLFFTNLKKAYEYAWDVLEYELGKDRVMGGWSYDTAARQIRKDQVAATVFLSRAGFRTELTIKKVHVV